MKAVFIASNLVIFFGYLVIAGYVAPRINLRRWTTRISGVVFFFTCGLTHLEIAYHTSAGGWEGNDLVSWHMLAIHIPQAVAVAFFVHGLYVELLAHDRAVWTKSLDIKFKQEPLDYLSQAARAISDASAALIIPLQGELAAHVDLAKLNAEKLAAVQAIVNDLRLRLLEAKIDG